MKRNNNNNPSVFGTAKRTLNSSLRILDNLAQTAEFITAIARIKARRLMLEEAYEELKDTITNFSEMLEEGLVTQEEFDEFIKESIHQYLLIVIDDSNKVDSIMAKLDVADTIDVIENNTASDVDVITDNAGANEVPVMNFGAIANNAKTEENDTTD